MKSNNSVKTPSPSSKKLPVFLIISLIMFSGSLGFAVWQYTIPDSFVRKDVDEVILKGKYFIAKIQEQTNPRDKRQRDNATTRQRDNATTPNITLPVTNGNTVRK